MARFSIYENESLCVYINGWKKRANQKWGQGFRNKKLTWNTSHINVNNIFRGNNDVTLSFISLQASLCHWKTPASRFQFITTKFDRANNKIDKIFSKELKVFANVVEEIEIRIKRLN